MYFSIKISTHPEPHEKRNEKTPDIGNLLAVSQKDNLHYKALIRMPFVFEGTE